VPRPEPNAAVESFLAITRRIDYKDTWWKIAGTSLGLGSDDPAAAKGAELGQD
jgi:hypothetical protein